MDKLKEAMLERRARKTIRNVAADKDRRMTNNPKPAVETNKLRLENPLNNRVCRNRTKVLEQRRVRINNLAAARLDSVETGSPQVSARIRKREVSVGIFSRVQRHRRKIVVAIEDWVTEGLTQADYPPASSSFLTRAGVAQETVK